MVAVGIYLCKGKFPRQNWESNPMKLIIAFRNFANSPRNCAADLLHQSRVTLRCHSVFQAGKYVICNVYIHDNEWDLTIETFCNRHIKLHSHRIQIVRAPKLRVSTQPEGPSEAHLKQNWHSETLSPSFYTAIFFISLVQCIRKVAVLLQKVLEVMSTTVYTRLNPFNLTCKNFLNICLWDVSYERSYCCFKSLIVLRYWQPNLRTVY
jgi:hypothetical protein